MGHKELEIFSPVARAHPVDVIDLASLCGGAHVDRSGNAARISDRVCFLLEGGTLRRQTIGRSYTRTFTQTIDSLH